MPISTATPTSAVSGQTIAAGTVASGCVTYIPSPGVIVTRMNLPSPARRTAQDLIKEHIEYLDGMIEGHTTDLERLLKQVKQIQSDIDAWTAERAQLQEDLGTLIEKALED